jgi:hypothetical protein
MGGAELVLQLVRNGMAFSLEGGRLECVAERPLPPELVEEAKAQREAIEEHLRALHYFGTRIGAPVLTPRGEGVVFGASLYGVSVIFPHEVVLLFDASELLALNRLPAVDV